MEKWHYILNGQNLGPVAREDILALVQSGQIKLETLVWKPGQADWQPLSAALPEVKPLATTPPPLSPPPLVSAPIPPPPALPQKSGLSKGCLIGIISLVVVGLGICVLIAGIFWVASSVRINKTFEITDSNNPQAKSPSSLIPSVKELQAIAVKEYKTYGKPLQTLFKGQIKEVYTNSILVEGKRRDFVTWQFEDEGTPSVFIYVRCPNEADAASLLEDGADKFNALAEKHAGTNGEVTLTKSHLGALAGAVAIQGTEFEVPIATVEKRLKSFLTKGLQIVSDSGSSQ